MTLKPHALLLLSAQRCHLAERPDERELTREWTRLVDEARSQGHLIAFVQWDGEPDTPGETFSKGWTLYPDFRAETGDVLVRAKKPDAFAASTLDADLKARAVQELRLIGLEGEALNRTLEAAQALGYRTLVVGTLDTQGTEDAESSVAHDA